MQADLNRGQNDNHTPSSPPVHVKRRSGFQKLNIAARAADREFNNKFRSNLGGAPWTPKKALPALCCSGWSPFSGPSHLSGAAALSGAELFPAFDFFLKKPLVWGSCAAWGRTSSRNLALPWRNHLSMAAALPGAELSQFLFETNNLFGAIALPGAVFFPEVCLYEEIICLGQCVAWERTVPGISTLL